jgi:hypothetical protein
MNRKQKITSLIESDAFEVAALLIIIIGIIVAALSGMVWTKMYNSVFEIENGIIASLYIIISLVESIFNGIVVGLIIFYYLACWNNEESEAKQ